MTKKSSYIGAPAHFRLDLAIKLLNEAFDEAACYLVGSCLERSDWRDIDVRMILEDEKFLQHFPDADLYHFQLDTRWQVINTSLSMWLKEQTGLPVDFQIQSMKNANGKAHEGKERQPVGLRMAKGERQ